MSGPLAALFAIAVFIAGVWIATRVSISVRMSGFAFFLLVLGQVVLGPLGVLPPVLVMVLLFITLLIAGIFLQTMLPILRNKDE